MIKRVWNNFWCGILTAAMLVASVPDVTAAAGSEPAEVAGEPEGVTSESADRMQESGTLDGDEFVEIAISGDALVEGLDEWGKASPGDKVSIEVTKPGYALVLLGENEDGAPVYTAMKLDGHNRYSFTAEQNMEFAVVDPEQVSYSIALAESRTAKITGAAGLKLNSVASSAQGYDEVVLNFTAVKNGSDGTDGTKAFYEVMVTSVAQDWLTPPAGSPEAPRFYYIPKTANQNTQSKSIKVNDGDLSESTAWTYEFAVRLVLLRETTVVPGENAYLKEPLTSELSGNTVTKRFSTKNPYFEDKIGFTKKTTKIFTGQSDVLAGMVKYSKKASYIHDLTAVAYDSTGSVCTGITCNFKNDNDELYVSAASTMKPGTYKIVIYAGIGEEETRETPQGGTMYQSNTSFSLTVQPGIYRIDTEQITGQAAVNNKNITFSAIPVAYSYYNDQKAKQQKFTYEIKSAYPSSSSADGYHVTEPSENVLENVSVDKNGKVTVKKGYYVNPDTNQNFIAIEITAADFPGNTTRATAYVQIVSEMRIPTQMYLVNSAGTRLGTEKQTELTADKAHEAKVIVLDQNGNNMNAYVNITPQDNASKTAAAYVVQSAEKDGAATLYVRKPTTITIKAVTKDGGQKSKSLQVKIKTPVFTTGRYTIDSVTYGGVPIDGVVYTNTGQVGYNSPKGTVIRYQQGAKINGDGCYHWDWFDWKYSVSGGRLKRDGEYFILTPTEKTAKVTMWLASDPDRTFSVKFTNNGWNVVYDAPPKLSLVEGKLYSTKYTNAEDVLKDIETGVDVIPPQRLVYTYDFGSYDQVKIAQITKGGPDLELYSFDPAKRRIELATDASYIKPGTYKYNIGFYRDGELMCKVASVAVRVTKSDKVSINANYTMDTAKSTEINLKCKPADFVPDFSARLLNANVGGKSNEFSKYFELIIVHDMTTGEDVTRAVVRLRSSLTDEEKAQIKGKKMTGYVKYSYYYGASYIKDATSKITIKVK